MVVFLLLLLISPIFGTDDEGGKYLEKAIGDIQKMQAQLNGNRRIDSVKSTTVPPLQLTKSELAAIYESAAKNGQTVKLNSDNGPPINALVHELDSHSEHSPSQGYYYYYYPLQSFIDEHDGNPNEIDIPQVHIHKPTSPLAVPPTPPQQLFHSHTHQHNVLISPPYNGMSEDKKPKGVEPLFMAISSFVGMAVMFVLSVVFLPRLSILKSRGVKPPPPGEMTNIARIAMEAIEGRDCAERLACEIGKRAKVMNLYDNRFVKLFRRMAPPSLAKEIDRVGKYTTKKNRCITIRCKRKSPAKMQQKQKTQVPPRPKNKVGNQKVSQKVNNKKA